MAGLNWLVLSGVFSCVSMPDLAKEGLQAHETVNYLRYLEKNKDGETGHHLEQDKIHDISRT